EGTRERGNTINRLTQQNGISQNEAIKNMSAAMAKVKIAQAIGKDSYSSLVPNSEYRIFADTLKSSFTIPVKPIVPIMPHA
ncbi:MAG: hypothetical protein SOV49_00990, partial [Erysipelotrichaceae bacterium]|nr:hypothetical protein [Erysipelotrichaceae bacterium]